MLRVVLGAALLFWCSLSVNTGSTQPQQPPYGLTIPGEVVRVIDGDTLEVEVRRVVRIRLLDCWAPETRTTDLAEKEQGLQAKAYLEGIAANKSVKVHIPFDRDGKFGDSLTFGRALGYVWVEGDLVSLSEQMVRSGHATKDRPK